MFFFVRVIILGSYFVKGLAGLDLSKLFTIKTFFNTQNITLQLSS